MIDMYNIAHKIKPFTNENELPINEEIVIEYMDENEKFFTLTGKVEIYNNERFFITKSSCLPMTFKSLDIKVWGLPLLKKEKGWISIKDKFPEKYNSDNKRTIEVLVFFNDIIEVGFYEFKNKSWYIDDARDSITSVTHWMHLPDKPILTSQEFVANVILKNGRYGL